MRKEKIVITGGLGYLGTELCKLYSGEAWYKDITVIDKAFLPERIRQLRDWGINFVQSDLFKIQTLQQTLDHADVIIHLAGITNVAYTKTGSNEKLDDEISRVGIEGTRNVIKNSPKNTKIIFASTHVIYEGVMDTKLDIEESDSPLPVLTYAKGKVQSEHDLINSNKNYVIIRLASVYGNSGEATRMKIMPNLFASMASQKSTIKLFSGGVQMKSLVPVFDVARCFKFMAEKSNINKDIFHCSKDSMTVKDVAEICKKFSPDLSIIETDDEIPNLGYTISSNKLLSTGFDFLHNIEDSIREMIEQWSFKPNDHPLEYIVKSHDHFIDARGSIGNFELTEPINLIGHITSKAGTIRANHYHPIQEQKCLLVKGQYISVIKDLSRSNELSITQIINAGDLSVIKPNVAHTMIFTKDSEFLNLVRGERDHDKYGVTHTIPHQLVDQEKASTLLATVTTNCRSCSSTELKRIISLGESPLANNLLDSPTDSYETYPLEMNYCPTCHNCQLSYTVDPSKMFDNYLYVSSTSSKFRKHFEDAASKYVKDYDLTKDSLVIDIGSNDGIALKPLRAAGIRAIGVEPAVNIAKIANEKGLETINGYFNDSIANQILTKYGKADLVTASNVFAHSDNLKDISRNTFNILKNDGSFIIEVQYIYDTISTLTFDNIYHEHANYWSVTSINKFFRGIGLFVNRVEHLNTHGGSIRVCVERRENPDSSLEKFLSNEMEAGLDSFSYYEKFSKDIYTIRSNCRRNIDSLKKEFKNIAGYGAPAKATTALNYFGITNDDIEYIIEDNELKHDKYIPGIGIPIKSKDHCLSNMPDLVIVMAWNFFDSIVEQNTELTENGVKFLNICDLYADL